MPTSCQVYSDKMRVQLDKPDKFKELEGHKLVGHVEKRGDEIILPWLIAGADVLPIVEVVFKDVLDDEVEVDEVEVEEVEEVETPLNVTATLFG